MAALDGPCGLFCNGLPHDDGHSPPRGPPGSAHGAAARECAVIDSGFISTMAVSQTVDERRGPGLCSHRSALPKLAGKVSFFVYSVVSEFLFQSSHSIRIGMLCSVMDSSVELSSQSLLYASASRTSYFITRQCLACQRSYLISYHFCLLKR